jgi:hypothetical protein
MESAVSGGVASAGTASTVAHANIAVKMSFLWFFNAGLLRGEVESMIARHGNPRI